MFGSNLSTLGRQAKCLGTKFHESGGVGQVHPAFFVTAICIVTRNLVMAAQSGDALARPPVAAPGRDGVTVDHSRNDLIGADSDQGAYRIDDFGWCVVAIHFLRLTPSMPSAFMSRATRFAPTLAL